MTSPSVADVMNFIPMKVPSPVTIPLSKVSTDKPVSIPVKLPPSPKYVPNDAVEVDEALTLPLAVT